MRKRAQHGRRKLFHLVKLRGTSKMKVLKFTHVFMGIRAYPSYALARFFHLLKGKSDETPAVIPSCPEFGAIPGVAGHSAARPSGRAGRTAAGRGNRPPTAAAHSAAYVAAQRRKNTRRSSMPQSQEHQAMRGTPFPPRSASGSTRRLQGAATAQAQKLRKSVSEEKGEEVSRE